MADIVVTLSRDKSAHTGSIAEEADWLEREGELCWPLRGWPSLDLRNGHIYFVEEGRIAARARVSEVMKIPAGRSFTGKKKFGPGPAAIYPRPMQFPRERYLPHKGFQGFKYVGGRLAERLSSLTWTTRARMSSLGEVDERDRRFTEGKPGFVRHLQLERNRAEVARFKAWTFSREGNLECEGGCPGVC